MINGAKRLAEELKTAIIKGAWLISVKRKE